MISKVHFNKIHADCFCQTPELIENYEQAIADKTQIWVCHHRDEIRVLPSGMIAIRSKKELIEDGRYFNCPPNELIFLTTSDHTKLHSKYIYHPPMTEAEKERRRNAYKGRQMTEEWKLKIGAALKGKTSKLKNTYRTEFGKKYFERFGYSRAANMIQYDKERHFYKYYGYCSWEKEE